MNHSRRIHYNYRSIDSYDLQQHNTLQLQEYQHVLHPLHRQLCKKEVIREISGLLHAIRAQTPSLFDRADLIDADKPFTQNIKHISMTTSIIVGNGVFLINPLTSNSLKTPNNSSTDTNFSKLLTCHFHLNVK